MADDNTGNVLPEQQPIEVLAEWWQEIVADYQLTHDQEIAILTQFLKQRSQS